MAAFAQISRYRSSWLRGLVCSLALLSSAAQAQQASGPLPVDEDGTVKVPAMVVPVSEFLSPEGKRYVAEHLQAVSKLAPGAPPSGTPPLIAPYVPRVHQLYATERQDTSIAGVRAYIYTPTSGISAANRERVLINLHGGGFQGAFPAVRSWNLFQFPRSCGSR